MGVAQLAERNFATLSGGEQRLVLIARALCQRSDILVMDGPTSSLDYGNQLRVLERVRQLARQGATRCCYPPTIPSTPCGFPQKGAGAQRRQVADGCTADVLTPGLPGGCTAWRLWCWTRPAAGSAAAGRGRLPCLVDGGARVVHGEDACERADFHEKLAALLAPYLKTDSVCDTGAALALSLAGAGAAGQACDGGGVGRPGAGRAAPSAGAAAISNVTLCVPMCLANTLSEPFDAMVFCFFRQAWRRRRRRLPPVPGNGAGHCPTTRATFVFLAPL